MSSNTRKLFIMASVLSTMLITGCTLTMRGEHTVRKPDGEIRTSSGEIILTDDKHSMLIRPFISLMANVGEFSYEDWSDLDASEFYLNVDDGAASSYVDGEDVSLTIWNGDTALSEKSFETVQIGSKIYFKTPHNVEDWAYTFIDVADKVTYEIDIYTLTDSSAQVTLSANDSSGTYASTTYTASRIDDDCARFGCDPL